MRSTMKQPMARPLLIAIALVVAMVAGCAGTGTRESTGEYIDDASITTRVKARFVQDEQISALRINVETFRGSVQLSGFANTEAERLRAVELARSVPGVKEVKDDIRLKQARGSAPGVDLRAPAVA